MNNCYKCLYAKIYDDKVLCSRPLKTEGRLAYIPPAKVELECCCNSNRDRMKRAHQWIDDGLFHVSPKRLKDIENHISDNKNISEELIHDVIQTE